MFLQLSIFSCFATGFEEGVEFKPASEAEKEATSPRNITWGDVLNLLRFSGVELTPEQQMNFIKSFYTKGEEGDLTTKFANMTREEQTEFLKLHDIQKETFLGLTEEKQKEFLQIKEEIKPQVLLDSQRDNTVSARRAFSAQQTSLKMASHQIKNFHIEALVFYAAIGATMARSAYTDSITKEGRADPRWMENFIHEMTSPIGVFSFFCFVIASGQTNVLTSKLIGKWTTPATLRQNLYSRQRVAINTGLYQSQKRGFTHKIKYGRTYYGARMGHKVLNSLGGPLGMSVGMLASNIVHELDYVYSYSPNARPCIKYLMGQSKDSSGNSKFHCTVFWESMGHTVRSWGPGLVSLISASMISHALVNAAYVSTGRGVSLTGSFLKGTRIKLNSQKLLLATAQKAPFMIAPLRGARWMGTGMAKAGGWMLQKLSSMAPYMFSFIRPGSLGHRFLNLYAFMEVDALFTHKAVDYLWTSKMNSASVAEGMTQLIEHYNVDAQTPKLLCDQGKEETGPQIIVEDKNCEFHDSVVSAYQSALQFSRWREYQMQIPAMAYQNWLQYISDAIGSFDQVYRMYTEFLLFKETRFGSLANANALYFGPFTLGSEGEYLLLRNNQVILSVFNNMLEKITSYLDEKSITPKLVDLKVVSTEPSRFLQSHIRVKASDKIHVLRGLFSAVNPNVSLEKFYSNYEELLNKEKEDIERRAFYGENPEILKNLDELAEDVLRKRVLAAGIEYLNKVLEQEKNKNIGYVFPLSEELKNQEESLHPVTNIFRLVGPNNIFAHLYQETFVAVQTGETTEAPKVKYIPITPLARGMDLVESLNYSYAVKGSEYQVDYHSNRVKRLITPGMMDFIVASAVCGPDLSSDKNQKILKKIRSITESPNPKQAFEQEFTAPDNRGDLISPEVFTGKSVDEIMKFIPLFDREIVGTSYTFLAPRMPQIKLDGEIRNRICNGLDQQRKTSNPMVEDIYNSRFVVEGKEYNNLLDLVLAHLELEEDFILEHVFNWPWWENQVEPYYDFFLLLAEREYRNIVRHAFMEPMFTDSQKEVMLVSSLSEDKQVVWKEITTLTKPVFNYSEYRFFPFELPKGVFQNIYFEARYWSDIILYFVQKKEVPLGENEHKELQRSLEYFAEVFNTKTTMDGIEGEFKTFGGGSQQVFQVSRTGAYKATERVCTSSPDEQNLQACQEWLQHFTDPKAQRVLQDLLNKGIGEQLAGVTELLGISLEQLLVNSNPTQNGQIEQLTQDELVAAAEKSVGAFKCDTQVTGDCEVVSVPQQILNYSIIRLNQLIEEAKHFANQVGYISNSPDAVKVRETSL